MDQSSFESADATAVRIIEHDNRRRRTDRDFIRQVVDMIDAGHVETARSLLNGWADVLDHTYVTASLVIHEIEEGEVDAATALIRAAYEHAEAGES